MLTLYVLCFCIVYSKCEEVKLSRSGANTGIGKETAKDISKRGARVIILCRNIDKAKAAAEEISKETGGTVEVEKLDLSSLKSVRECAQKLLEKV